MNRRSLFGRIVDRAFAYHAADRPELFRAHLEALEDRKLLTFNSGTAFVASNWVDLTATNAGTVAIGDTLVYGTNGSSPLFGPGASQYGTDEFGTVTSVGHIDGGTGNIAIDSGITPTRVSGAGLIHDAIQNTPGTAGSLATVALFAGTYAESDIVIDRPTHFVGNNEGTGTSVIIPDIASTHTIDANYGSNPLNEDFTSGSHDGIIIYSPDVTVEQVTVNGDNPALDAGPATANFQQGITNLYYNPGTTTFNATNPSYTGVGVFVGRSVGGGNGNNEVQTITVPTTTPNTFYLTFLGYQTGPLTEGAGAGTIQSALNGVLATIPDSYNSNNVASTTHTATVTVTGSGTAAVFDSFGDLVTPADPYVVTFDGGSAANRSESLIGGFAGNVTSAVQSVEVPVTTGGYFSLGWSIPGVGVDRTIELTYGATAAQVQSALNTVVAQESRGGAGSVTVSGAGTSGSPYLVTFGGSLVNVPNNTITGLTDPGFNAEHYNPLDQSSGLPLGLQSVPAIRVGIQDVEPAWFNQSITNNGTGQNNTKNRPDQTLPDLLVDHSVVTNTFWHGITMAARPVELYLISFPGGFSPPPANYYLDIEANTVSNVGVGTPLTDPTAYNRIGILMSNMSNSTPSIANGNAEGGVIAFNTISGGVPVGIEDTNFGSFTKNSVDIQDNTVFNAPLYGIANYNLDGISNPEAPPPTGVRVNSVNDVGLSLATITTYKTVGIYANHSADFLMGLAKNQAYAVSGAYYGFYITNSPVSNPNGTETSVLSYNTTLQGPGTGIAGSVGMFVTNSADLPSSTFAAILFNGAISNFETGISIGPTVNNSDNSLDYFLTNTLNVAGNKTGVALGTSTYWYGNGDSTDPIVLSGSSTMAPGFPNPGASGFYTYVNSDIGQPIPPAPQTTSNFSPGPHGTITIAPHTVDSIGVKNLTLSASSGLDVTLATNSGIGHVINDFTTPVPGSVYPSGGDWNPWHKNYKTIGAYLSWNGNAVQNGNGVLVVTGPNPIGAIWNDNPSNLINIVGDARLQIVAKQASVPPGKVQDAAFIVGLQDAGGNDEGYSFPTSGLSSTTWTTLTISLDGPTLGLNNGDKQFNLSAIEGIWVGSDFDFADGDGVSFPSVEDPNSNNQVDILFQSISTTAGSTSDQIVVASGGTVSLNGAALTAGSANNAATTFGQVYTIVQNNGTNAINGTFLGLPHSNNTDSQIGIGTNAAIAVSEATHGDATHNEVQNIVITQSPAPTNFTLSFNGFTTSQIPFGASASTVQVALNVAVGAAQPGATVTVSGLGTSGSPYQVTFGGTAGLSAQNFITGQSNYGDLFQINYAAGPNADSITLTQVKGDAAHPLSPANGPQLALNQAPQTWTTGGAANIASNTATLTDSETGLLNSMTITLSNAQAADSITLPNSFYNQTLTAFPHVAIFSRYSYNSTSHSGSLVLYGSDTLADYLAVLKQVTFNNGGPIVGTKTITVSANDGAQYITASTTISPSAPVVQLNSPSANYATSWSGSPVNIAGSASVTDAESASLASTAISTPASPAPGTSFYVMIATISNFHTGDILTATPAGSLVIEPWDPVDQALEIMGNGTLADYQNTLASIQYNNTSGGPPAGTTVTINVSTQDAYNSSNTAVATITTGSAPVLQLNAPNTNYSTTWTNAGAVAVTNAGAVSITDPGHPNLASLTVSITSPHTGDALAGPVTGGGITVTGTGTSTLVLTGSASLATYQTDLGLVTYNNTNGGPGVASEALTVVANDGTLPSNTATSTVNISVGPTVKMNAPNTNYSTAWVNGGGAVNVAGGVAGANASIFDGEGLSNLASLTVSVSAAHAGDALTGPVTGGGITVSGSGTGTLILSGSASVAAYRADLAQVQYNNTSGGPGVSSVTVNVVGNDGTLSGNTAATTIAISGAPPVIHLNGVNVNYTNPTNWATPAANASELLGAVNVASSTTVTITDGESATLNSMTVALSGPSTTSGDFLIGSGNNNIHVSNYNQTTGVVIFTGVDTLAHYVTALESVKYNNASTVTGPGKPAISVTVTANDGIALSNVPVGTVNIVQAPKIQLNVGTVNYNTQWSSVPSATAVNITGAGPISAAGGFTAPVLSSAESANLTSMTVTITSPHAGDILTGTGSGAVTVTAYNPTTGQLVLSGTATPTVYQTVLGSVKYNNTSGGPGVGVVSVTVKDTDGTLTSNTATATVNINTSATIPSIVSGSYLFYDHSLYSGGTSGSINLASKDNAAIDPLKTGYLGSALATVSNVSGFTLGVTGIMFDLTPSSTASHASITAASDLTLRVSGLSTPTLPANWNTPSSWSAAPAPASLTVRAGGGAGGSDRVEITWNDNAIKNEWLEVTVKAEPTGHTGLATATTFFFGNLAGMSGVSNAGSNAIVGAGDDLDARLFVGAVPNPVYTIYDYNKSKAVGAEDPLYARNNQTTLRLLNVNPLNFAPDAGPSLSPSVTSDTSSVTSALASAAGSSLTSSSSSGANLSWLGSRLSSVDLNSGVPAQIFEALARSNSPGAHTLLADIDQLADDQGLDDTLLDSLLGDMD